MYLTKQKRYCNIIKQVQKCTHAIVRSGKQNTKTIKDERRNNMSKKMYVDVIEVCEDWGVSRAQGYKMIKELNDRMKAINPNLIVLAGKANRRFYEENCYGMAKEA